MSENTADVETPPNEEDQKYREDLASAMWDENPDITLDELDVEPDGDDPGVATEDEDDGADGDPWAGVDPLVREKISELDERIQSVSVIEERLKQAERRVGSIQNSITNTGQRKLTEEQQKEIDEFKEDFPEFYNVVGHLTAGAPPAGDADLDSRLDAVKSEMDRRIEIAQLSFAHPDYETQIKSNDYQKWLIDQEPELKNLVNSTRATDAIKVLNKFKADVLDAPRAADVAQNRQQRLRAAQTTKGRSVRPAKSEADMTDSELRAKIAREVWS